MFTLTQKITWFAFHSRIIVILFSALFNFLIPDHNAGVYLVPLDPSIVKSTCDQCIEFLLGGLVRWDGHYFIHIASYGYTYENCLAFFPLYPLTIRVIAGILKYPLHGIINQYSIIILSSVLINIICFIKSASILYQLGLIVLKDKGLAYKAAILYCINPASIFFTAPYSEAMFACCTFYGMLMCANGRYIDSGCPFGLSAAARSNGILNIGFIVEHRLKHFLHNVLPSSLSRVQTKVQMCYTLSLEAIQNVVSLAIAVTISLAPFAAFQVYSYYKFCMVTSYTLPDFLVQHAKIHNFVLPGSNSSLNLPSHWCKSPIPLAYSYVQSHYWEVGFLRYYTWKQIPNFMLAMPIVLMILTQSYEFVRQHPRLCRSLGLYKYTNIHDDENSFKKRRVIHPDEKEFSPRMLVYIIHAVFLTVFCILCAHVQVTTRIVASASPVLYWFAAYLFPSTHGNKLTTQFKKIAYSKSVKEMDSKIESFENLSSSWKVSLLTQTLPHGKAKVAYYYFILYFFLGTILFSNFYPWT